jgi:DNA-binding transcriptional ArsR family regulator
MRRVGTRGSKRNVYALTVIYAVRHTQKMTTNATIDAIAEPHRRRILDELRLGERSVNILVGRLDLSQPAVSKHLRVLRDAGLVRVRAHGQQRLYSVRPESLVELDDWLEPYRAMWQASLDKLEQHLNEVPTKGEEK